MEKSLFVAGYFAAAVAALFAINTHASNFGCCSLVARCWLLVGWAKTWHKL